MDLASKEDDNNIEALCKEICKSIRERPSQNIKHLVGPLRKLSGLHDCECPGTPVQRLSRLLRFAPPLTDYSIGLSIIGNYGTLSDKTHCRTSLQHILQYSFTDSAGESRQLFWNHLWTYPGLKDFDMNIIEEFLHCYSKFLEEDICNVFESVLSNQEVAEKSWHKQQNERIIIWSSKSTKVFAIVVSILNSLLQRIIKATKYYNDSINVVSHFAEEVKLLCHRSNADFVRLYPREFHSLVCLLDIDPELFPKQTLCETSICQEGVVKMIKQSLAIRPVQTLCILTHFPRWTYYINR